jgi:hypothetical protein
VLLFVHRHFFHQNLLLSRRTHINEVIADVSDLDSKSMMAIFALPPVALPQPRPRVQEVPRLNQATSSSGSGSSIAAQQGCQLLGGFVQTQVGVITICLPRHATALIGIMQLAGAHPSGLLGSMGHGNRQAWFQSTASTLFQSDGPLGGFNKVSASVLMQHVGAAEGHARGMYG